MGIFVIKSLVKNFIIIYTFVSCLKNRVILLTLGVYKRRQTKETSPKDPCLRSCIRFRYRNILFSNFRFNLKFYFVKYLRCYRTLTLQIICYNFLHYFSYIIRCSKFRAHLKHQSLLQLLSNNISILSLQHHDALVIVRCRVYASILILGRISYIPDINSTNIT